VKVLRTGFVWPLTFLLFGLLASCSTIGVGVDPWEHDLLAKPSMQFDRLDNDIDDHIYFSKEASSGGRAYGGGGCGCN
jgi:hypothetical protein